MLFPKKVKYRKTQRGRLKGKVVGYKSFSIGNFAIQALEPTLLTSKQIEAVRKTISKYIKKIGKLWIKVFPDKPITARPKDSRMGSGKGSLKCWAAVVRKGALIFELFCPDSEIAIRALHLAKFKLPIKTKVLQKI
jgi:large subunit ribosomal protein L16